MTTTDPVVTQAVRDAASDYADSVATGGLARVAAQYIREGRSDDCELVQAFAKLEAQARLEGERAGMEKAARIVEAEREFRRQCQERAKTKQEQRDFETMSIACTHVLTAIRNTGATK